MGLIVTRYTIRAATMVTLVVMGPVPTQIVRRIVIGVSRTGVYNLGFVSGFGSVFGVLVDFVCATRLSITSSISFSMFSMESLDCGVLRVCIRC